MMQFVCSWQLGAATMSPKVTYLVLIFERKVFFYKFEVIL